MTVDAKHSGHWLQGFVPCSCLVIFLTAGIYKAATAFRSLPDLTIVFAIFTILFCMIIWLSRNFRLPSGSGIFILMLLTFLPGVLTMSAGYGQQKVEQTFTLGFLAYLAPLFILRSRRDVTRFLWLFSLLGGLMAILALSGHVNPTEFGRYAVLNTTTITTGRVIGFALIVIFMFTLGRIVPILPGVIAIGVLSYAMVGTGARGPLLALVMALIVAALVHRTNVNFQRHRGAIVVITLIVLFLLAYKAAPYYSQIRILTFGDSGSARIVAWRATLDAIPTHPFGIGWGNWQSFVGSISSTENQLIYPHNLILEVLLEGGWIAGLGLLMMLARVGVRAYRQTNDYVGRSLFALYVFFLVNSLVSDDLKGARILFAICGAIVANGNILRNPVRAEIYPKDRTKLVNLRERGEQDHEIGR